MEDTYGDPKNSNKNQPANFSTNPTTNFKSTRRTNEPLISVPT